MLLGSWKIDVAVLVTIVLTLLYLVIKRTYSYWQRKGFKAAPDFNYFLGHFSGSVLQKESIGQLVYRLYKSTTDPFIGIYSVLSPVLLVRDPDLVRSILIKDFSDFTDRGVHCNADYDPLSAHLFALPGNKWKHLRGKLTPTFTSGKLKAMFGTLVDCGATLQEYIEKKADTMELIDVHETAARYTTNIIASVGFGIEVDTINDPNNEFRVCGRNFFAPTIANGMRLFLNFIAPRMMSLFRIKFVQSSIENFIRSVVRESLEHREKNHVVRKDFFQLLVQLRNNGTVQLDDEWETVIKADESQKTLTENEIAAQTFVFFLAGFETSSTTLSFCLFELSKNPDIQQRVYDEIHRVLDEHGGQITYESIMDMKYLDACIDETLRKYPIVPVLNRACVNDYRIPGTNQIIEKDVQVFISVMGLHWDEKYYEQPEKFDPERFSEENSIGKTILNRPYIPFGDGPRNCIGMRLGKMQTKVGLVVMLQKFRFELNDRDRGSDEMKFDPKCFVLSKQGGVHLYAFKRQTV